MNNDDTIDAGDIGGDDDSSGKGSAAGVGAPGILARIKKGLGLTDEQKKQLAEGVKKVRPEDEERVRREVPRATEEAKKRGAVPELLDGVRTLWAMLKDADYQLPWQSKALIIFALGYFVSPVDAVPDAIPVLGYVDDLLVVAWVLHQLQGEVVAYRKLRGLDGPTAPGEG